MSSAAHDEVMRTRAVGKVQTSSGILFDVLFPKVEDIHLTDIAHALAQQCRFSGHTVRPYSVAEHSVWVSHLVRPELAREALLHDASEAYVVDLPRPLKHLPELAGYRELERRVEEAIARRWNVPASMHPEVKAADVMMLAAECRQLMRWQDAADWWGELATRELPSAIVGVRLGVSAVLAEQLFLRRAAELGVR